MPSTFVNQRINSSEATARVTESGIEANLYGLKITFPPRGFMVNTIPGGVPGNFGFIKLDDEDGPGHLVASAFPVNILGSSRTYIVHLVLPKGNAGITVPPSGLTLLLEGKLVPDQQTLEPSRARSAVHLVLQEWAQTQKMKPVIEAILLDPAAEKAPGTAEYKVPAVVVEWESVTPRQQCLAAMAERLKKTKWTIT
jgi:hypothetical protein